MESRYRVFSRNAMFILLHASFSDHLTACILLILRTPLYTAHVSRIRYARAQFRLFYFRSSSIYSAAGRLVMSRNVIRRYLIERIDPLGEWTCRASCIM